MKRRIAKTAGVGCILLVLFLCAFTSMSSLVKAMETPTLTIGGTPYAVAITPDGKYAYVPNESNVTVIDTGTNQVASTVTAENWVPNSIAITPDGKYAYVTNEVTSKVPDGVVSVIDLASNTITATVTLGKQDGNSAGTLFPGIAVSPDGKYVYVTDCSQDSVHVISTSTNTVTANISIVPQHSGSALPTIGFIVPPHSAPNAVAITPDSKSAYVANGEGSVSVIDTAKNTVTTTINFVNSTAKAVAITPNGNYVYVCITNDTDGNVYVISTATNKVTATITTDSVEGIVISPDGERAYLALGGDNTVAVIDTATNTLTKTVSAGLNPSAIAITPDGKYAYVVCDSYTEFTDRPGANYVGTVSVISTGNGAASPQVTPVAEVPAQLLIEVILVGVIVISVGVIVVKLKLWKKQSPNTQCMLIPLFS